MKIYKHSHFLSDPFGHGGNRRSTQIDEILSRFGLEIKKADFNLNIPTNNKFGLYLNGLLHNKNLMAPAKTNYAIGRYRKLFNDFVRKERPDLFVWESTFEYMLLLAEVLHDANIPVIALPHNLESLVPGSISVFSGKSFPDWLAEELGYLKLCTDTFTISQEESWLLSTAGLSANWLPYYPPVQVLDFLLSVREQKQQITNQINANKNLLLLGTFYNSPTADGYRVLIEQLKHHQNITLHIAGYGSAELTGQFTGKSNIKIHGEVNNNSLAELIAICDYAIVHQQPSSGALTRIPELLISGIPVLANIHASRSCSQLKGVNTYHSFEQLTAFLESPPEQPPVPDPPDQAEKQFIERILALTEAK